MAGRTLNRQCRIGPIRIPKDHGNTSPGRVEGQSQAGREALGRQEGLKVLSRQSKRRRLWLHDGSWSGYERPIGIMSGAMTSSMSEPMMDGPFGCRPSWMSTPGSAWRLLPNDR